MQWTNRQCHVTAHQVPTAGSWCCRCSSGSPVTAGPLRHGNTTGAVSANVHTARSALGTEVLTTHITDRTRGARCQARYLPCGCRGLQRLGVADFTRQLNWVGSSPLASTWEGCSWRCQLLWADSYKLSTSPWHHGASSARVLT
jgi:hypothetical protein